MARRTASRKERRVSMSNSAVKLWLESAELQLKYSDDSTEILRIKRIMLVSQIQLAKAILAVEE